MADNGKLTPKQEHAISTLLVERNVKAAATAAGVGYRTLRGWLDLPHFARALRDAQAQVVGDALRKLADVMGRSVDVLSNLIADDDPATKLAAIRIVMSAWPALKQAEDFERRLSALEQATKQEAAKS